MIKRYMLGYARDWMELALRGLLALCFGVGALRVRSLGNGTRIRRKQAHA